MKRAEEVSVLSSFQIIWVFENLDINGFTDIASVLSA